METARLLVALVAAITALGGLFADYLIPFSARQHMSNPKWPPHAKFHNGQTIALGFGLGIMTFVVLYGMPFFDRGVLLLAAALASLYWVCLLAAAIFPGTGWTDPEFEAITPKPFGMHIQQVISFVLLTLLIIAVALSYL
jgi:hypothetical protein